MHHLCTNKLNFFLDRQTSNKKTLSESLNQNAIIPFISPFSYFANSKEGLLFLYSGEDSLLSPAEKEI